MCSSTDVAVRLSGAKSRLADEENRVTDMTFGLGLRNLSAYTYLP